MGFILKMDDLTILKQLINGNHLNKIELERVKKLIHNLNINLNNRLK